MGIKTHNNNSLFYRLCWRSLRVRRSQAWLGIGSLAAGAAVCSLLLSLYGGVQRKMSQSFSAFGANAVIAPRATSQASTGLPSVMSEPSPEQFQALERRVPGVAAVPVLYAVVSIRSAEAYARLPDGQRLVAAGSDLSDLWRMYPSWRLESLSASPGPDGCAVGRHVASELGLQLRDKIELRALSPGSPEANARSATFRVTAIVSTGAAEDNQVFVPLAALQALTNTKNKISAIELRIPGSKIAAAVSALAGVFPEAQVRPVRQIVYSQGKVLGTLSRLMLALTILILAITALSVASAMTGMVMDRGKDIGLMKALGASDRTVMEIFLGEAAVLGLVGGIAGFAVGAFLAREVGQRLFHVALAPSGWIFPAVCFAAVLLAIVATLLPVQKVRGIQPVLALRE
jgi:putative ABC transport system permease protein